MNAPHPDFAETVARQREAADPAASAWVEANAGSGKTRVLIDRVSRLLLAGADPARILCITYTKAAAAEMSERLFARLGAWSLASDADLRVDLHQVEGGAAQFTAEDLRAARRLFARALETPGGLKIQTIHGFCESVLRRFPLEAGVPVQFRIVEEAEAKALLGAAMDAAALAPDAASELDVLALRYGEKELRDLLQDVVAGAKAFDPGAIAGGLGGAVEALAQELGVDPTNTDESVLAAFFESGWRARYMAAAGALRDGTKTDQDMAPVLERAAQAADRRQAFEALRKLFCTDTNEPRKTVIHSRAANAHPESAAFLTDRQARFQKADEALRALRVFRESAALMRHAARVAAVYAGRKAAAGVLDFNDMIAAVRALFSDSAAAAWVLYKLDGGLSHILVDEAQDTSPHQWEVILAPLREFFAGAGARTEAEGPRTVFAVGDEKQSIYSFQGADIGMFSEMQGALHDLVTGAGAQWRPKELLLSFRSAPVILQAVDVMFADGKVAEGVATGASDKPGEPLIRHKAYRRGAAGLVELWPPIKAERAGEALAWDAPLDQESETSPRARLAAKIAATIAHWLETGEPLSSQGRPVAPGDIMILVRRRDAFFEQMIRALKLRGVPVAGADRLTLKEDIAVMDLLSLARFALTPRDDLALAEVLKSPLIGWSEEALFEAAYGRRGALWSAVRASPLLEPADRAFLAECVAEAGAAAPFDFFARGLDFQRDGASGRRRFYRRLGGPAREAIDEFLNLALAFEAAHPPTLQGFVDWVARREAEIKRDQDRDGGAVQVMTAHGAKGLEAEIVFLPDTCQKPQKPAKFYRLESGALATSPLAKCEPKRIADLRRRDRRDQDEEYRRLLYVAATRARDRLYIAGYTNLQNNGSPAAGSWYDIAARALTPLMTPAVGADGEPVLRMASAQTDPIEADERAAPAPSAPPPAWLAAPARVEPRPAPRTPSTPAAAGDFAFSPVATPADGLSPRERGRLIHQLLERLPNASAEARPALAEAWLARRRLAPELRGALAREALAVIAHPALADAFGPHAKAEAPILGRDADGGEVFGQVDRLAATPDRVLILDYKTDRPPPSAPEDTPPSYLRQMALYRRVLQGVFPAKEVACVLVWTFGARVMPLPPALLDAALARM